MLSGSEYRHGDNGRHQKNGHGGFRVYVARDPDAVTVRDIEAFIAELDHPALCRQYPWNKMTQRQIKVFTSRIKARIRQSWPDLWAKATNNGWG